jgi:hypothetical protein
MQRGKEEPAPDMLMLYRQCLGVVSGTEISYRDALLDKMLH